MIWYCPKDTMLRLPNEVLVCILNNLYHVYDGWETHGSKDDLLSTRGVCRRLALIATSSQPLFPFDISNLSKITRATEGLVLCPNPTSELKFAFFHTASRALTKRQQTCQKKNSTCTWRRELTGTDTPVSPTKITVVGLTIRFTSVVTI